VRPAEVSIRLVSGKLIISGERLAPEPAQGGCTSETGGLESGVKTVRVLAMEIDYGDFERELELPADADYMRPQSHWENGLLWIEIPRRHHA
jgi:HSP20 family molecular chaperone IbpA